MQRTPFEIPAQMRDAADKSVAEARRAFDQFIDATQQAVAKAEGSVKSMREGAADVNRQALAFVEENVAASFDLAQKLVRAHTIEEVAAVQQEFLRLRMEAMTEQGKALGGMVGRAMKSE